MQLIESQEIPGSRRRVLGRSSALLLSLIVVVTGLVWGSFSLGRSSRADSKIQLREVTARGPLLDGEKHLIDVFRSASRSAVHVTTFGIQQRLFGPPRTREAGTGTGTIWDDEGHIITNYHVIAPGLELARRGHPFAKVTLSDHSVWEARPVGLSPQTDLAVIKIDAPKRLLRPIPVGSSEDLLVGQSVLAIGNPFGLDQTLTTGVVSALNREIRSLHGNPIKDMIQTDAAINPGNSGGPLLDSAGRLIGVNTAIFSPSGTSSGVGFAIPVDQIFQVIPELIAYGERRTPGLGVVITAAEQQRGIKGLLVVDVLPGGSADRAGIRSYYQNDGKGDVIVAVEGKPTFSARDLQKALGGKQIGETVEIELLRAGRKVKLSAELQKLPN